MLLFQVIYHILVLKSQLHTPTLLCSNQIVFNKQASLEGMHAFSAFLEVEGSAFANP